MLYLTSVCLYLLFKDASTTEIINDRKQTKILHLSVKSVNATFIFNAIITSSALACFKNRIIDSIATENNSKPHRQRGSMSDLLFSSSFVHWLIFLSLTSVSSFLPVFPLLLFSLLRSTLPLKFSRCKPQPRFLHPLHIHLFVCSTKLLERPLLRASTAHGN